MPSLRAIPAWRLQFPITEPAIRTFGVAQHDDDVAVQVVDGVQDGPQRVLPSQVARHPAAHAAFVRMAHMVGHLRQTEACGRLHQPERGWQGRVIVNMWLRGLSVTHHQLVRPHS